MVRLFCFRAGFRGQVNRRTYESPRKRANTAGDTCVTVDVHFPRMTGDTLLERETTSHVIGAFFEVYNTLGYGFLERVCADTLEIELREHGRSVRREVAIPIWYKGRRISPQRVEMVVDDRVLLEIKSTNVLPLEAERQLMNYLRASSLSVGLLLHFGPEPRFRRRVQSEKNRSTFTP